MLVAVRAIPVCCWCGHKARIQANGTATAHKVHVPTASAAAGR